MAALENPEGDFINTNGDKKYSYEKGSTRYSMDRVPDITAAVKKEFGKSYIMGRFVGRYINVSNSVDYRNRSRKGYGIGLSGSYSVIDDKLTLGDHASKA